jgi:hypothetical protein
VARTRLNVNPNPLKPATVNRELDTLKSILAKAEEP